MLEIIEGGLQDDDYVFKRCLAFKDGTLLMTTVENPGELSEDLEELAVQIGAELKLVKSQYGVCRRTLHELCTSCRKEIDDCIREAFLRHNLDRKGCDDE